MNKRKTKSWHINKKKGGTNQNVLENGTHANI